MASVCKTLAARAATAKSKPTQGTELNSTHVQKPSVKKQHKNRAARTDGQQRPQEPLRRPQNRLLRAEARARKGGGPGFGSRRRRGVGLQARDDDARRGAAAARFIKAVAVRRALPRAPRRRTDERAREGRAVVDGVTGCVEIKILRLVRAKPSRRPPRHRRDACSMAWRCRFVTARRSWNGHVIAEK